MQGFCLQGFYFPSAFSAQRRLLAAVLPGDGAAPLTAGIVPGCPGAPGSFQRRSRVSPRAIARLNTWVRLFTPSLRQRLLT